MEAFALYLFRSVVWLTGFALVYLLFLRNERYFLLNRVYLLAGIVASIVFPFFTWHYTVVIPVTPTVEVSELLMTGIVMEPEAFPTETILFYAYLAGALYLLYRIIRQTVKVIGVIRHAEILPYRSAKLIRTPLYPSSFSFFSFVFVNPSSSETETGEIVNHELEHVRQRHWIDLVLFELLCTLQWLNPLCWLYGRFIRQNHEFLADQHALQRSANPAIYRAALINQLFGGEVISLANSFSYSINKKRFHMMKNTIHPPYRKLKLLVILPMIAAVFYAFSAPEYRYANANEDFNPTSSVINQLTNTDLENIQDGSTGIISGKVLKPDGSPLESATVVVSDFSLATMTNIEGQFHLKNVPANAELVISYVGYENKKVKPEEGKPMIITMTPANKEVGEVTVTGYGISTGQYNLGTSLKLQTNSPLKFGNPDGSSAQPLIVVDGVIVENQNVNNIPPETIESISVLKDASSKAVYGEKGKNGVILINTKKGAATTQNNLIDVNIQDDQTQKKQQINPNLIFPESAFPSGPPLYIIDGKISDIQEAHNVPQNTIKSYEIMKGSATKIYGDKGKNGVILINTNKGAASLQGDTKKSEITSKENDIFLVVEEMPEFPGGDAALRNFLASNVKYPAEAQQKGVQGKVYISFIVTKTGTIANAKIVRGVTPSLDQEAIRVVNLLPTWKPGKQKGEAVNVSYTVPINFVLEGDTKKSNTSTEENPVFFIVEEMPYFPGGDAALREFIAKSVKYPAEAQHRGFEGKVYVNFTVTKTGSIANAKIARGVDPLLDQEAIRVVNSLPTWKPGKQGGKNVDVSYTVPINFVLQGGPKKIANTLIIVDGKEVSRAEADKLNPQSMQSVEILKSESATTLYGEKGKEGAFLITLKKPDSKVYTGVDQMPEFPGGIQAMLDYISSNVKYPVIALENGIHGKVFVAFVVSKTGSISSAKIARSVDPSLDKEALRVINSMPKWTPGKHQGEAVDVEYVVPVDFSLPKDYKKILNEKLRTPYNAPKTINQVNSAQAGKLVIVPNPTNNKAIVTMEGSNYSGKLQVNLFDMNGKLMRKETKEGPSFSLSVNSLSPGTYLIVTSDGSKQYQGHLVVSK